MELELLKERKEMILRLFSDASYKPMRLKELCILLDIPKTSREELKEVLDALLNEGKISVSEKGKYGKADMFTPVGVFEGNARGYGFVKVEGMEQDIFIPAEYTNTAMHKDTVKVVVLPGETGRSPEGRVVKVIERGTTELVGTFQRSRNFGFVVPDNQKYDSDIFVPIELSMGAVTGHKVVVRLTGYGERKRKPEGRVVEIIGHVNDPGTDILSVVRAYEIPMEFPQEVMKQTEGVGEEVTGKDIAGRMDCRSWQTVTIDGEDAKDLDDAITLTKEGDRYRLGVHIADVTHYVTEGSPLDAEALKRGTSVYLVDRVIPMLPHKLSNGICSLNAGTDRLALSCIMDIDAKGNVVDHRICETVICVDRRMSYTSVKKILADQDEAEIAEYEELVPMFRLMEELSGILRQKRYARGAIDFDFPEAKIYLNEKGIPTDIKPYERNVATKIIEDFMLLANETVAEDYFWQQTPFVYRTHENPDEERMLRFCTFVNNLGYSLRMSNAAVHPKELQKLLRRIEGTSEEALISRVMLRSMKKAKYAPECLGHYGLASSYYTHFTSPIRRYPDLQIHRIIKDSLHGGLSERQAAHYESILPEVCAHSSSTERRADEAERETEKLKKVQYMKQHMYEVFEGVVSGITNYGMYVELPNTVEGMVHITTLTDDYYTFYEDQYLLKGRSKGNEYHLGDKVYVQVIGTDDLMHTIDFAVCDQEGNLQAAMEKRGDRGHGKRKH